MKHIITSFAFGSALALVGQPILASTVNITFTGVVDSSALQFDNSVAPGGLAGGETVTGTISYDAADYSIGNSLDPTSSRYTGTGSVALNVDGQAYSADLTDIEVRDGGANTLDEVRLRFSNISPTVSVPGYINAGAPGGSFTFTQTSLGSESLVESNALPTTASELNLSAGGSGVLGNFVRSETDSSSIDAYNIQFSLGSVSVNNDTTEGAGPPTTNISPTFAVSSDFNVGGDIGSDFNKDAPTVIITHGRQPGGTSDGILEDFGRYTGNPFDIQDLQDSYDAIKTADPSTNVILVTWEGAFVRRAGSFRVLPTDSFVGPLADTYEVGIGAAEQISSLIGDYEGEIHVIGHSYGTTVNNALAPELNRLGYDIQKLTVLDAPFELGLIGENLYGRYLNEQQYAASAAAAGVDFFENYYGTEGLTIDLDPAFGGPIPGATLGGGFEIEASHNGVFREYIDSINGNSAKLSVIGGGYNSPIGAPLSLLDAFDISSLGFGATSQSLNSTNEAGRALLNEGSDAFLFWESTELLNFDVFSFLIEDMSLGLDDWFEVQIGGQSVAFFDGGTTISGSEVFIPISGINFQDSSLAFFLRGMGEVDSTVSLSEFRGWKTDVELGPSIVPLPPTFGFALFSLLSLILLGRRHKSGSQ